MWNWIKKLIKVLFGIESIKLLPESKIPNWQDPIKIETVSLSTPRPKSADPITTAISFKDKISIINKDLQISNEELNDLADRIITDIIPKFYKISLENNLSTIIIFARDCHINDDRLKMVFPLVRSRLNALGVKYVVMYAAMHIRTNEITKASEKWNTRR